MKLEEYKSVDEKKEFFQYQQINTEEEFKEAYGELKNSPSCIFRGVREAKFKLYTSAQRVWIENDFDKSEVSYVDFIEELLSALKNNSEFVKYCDSLNVYQNDIFRLALLQHYTAPTPLLDFTICSDIALFFALQDLRMDKGDKIDNYFSIYSLTVNKELSPLDDLLLHAIETAEKLVGQDKCRYHQSINTLVIDEIDMLTAWKRENSNKDGFFKASLMFVPYPERAKRVRTPAKQELFYSNPNLDVQKGCFLLNNDAKRDIAEVIKGNEHIQRISCWDIHKSLVPYIREKIIPSIKEENMYPDKSDVYGFMKISKKITKKVECSFRIKKILRKLCY